MFDKWLKLPAHYYLRITALLILVVGIALSNVLMSIGAIWIIANWLIEAKFSEYRIRLKTSPELLLILIFLLYSVCSILWSDDFWFAFDDIRIKLPLLAIPLALGSGKPVEQKILVFLLYIFIGIVAFTGAINYMSYAFGEGVSDIRQMSLFISQIRFATLVDLAFFSCIYLLMQRKLHWLFALPLMLFFLFYTLYAQVLNGYILFGFLMLITFFYALFIIKSRSLKWVMVISVLIGIAGVFYVVSSAVKTYHGLDDYNWSELEFYTVNGNPYFHDTTNKTTENGHYVWLYVQQEELAKEWNERSAIAYDSVDRKGQPMYGTLLRYLTSKNERKDSAGLWSISDEEVRLVESGCTGINMHNGLESRIHAFLFEYEMYAGGADPNGFSLLQRLEHLKAASAILSEHWVLGVGIGDIDLHFQEYYARVNSKLLPENRLRSHNQFLSSWIALGLPGIILLTAWFLIPIIRNGKDYFVLIVLSSLVLAFMFEDMLETQAGATIFALFYSLAVFADKPNPATPRLDSNPR